MKIVNRETFLTLPENTVYMKVCDGEYGFGLMTVKANGPTNNRGENWGNDWVEDNFFVYSDALVDFPDLNTGFEFRFDDNQTVRDGLFEDGQMFCVFDNEDIQQVVNKLQNCLTPQINKTER